MGPVARGRNFPLVPVVGSEAAASAPAGCEGQEPAGSPHLLPGGGRGGFRIPSGVAGKGTGARRSGSCPSVCQSVRIARILYRTHCWLLQPVHRPRATGDLLAGPRFPGAHTSVGAWSPARGTHRFQETSPLREDGRGQETPPRVWDPARGFLRVSLRPLICCRGRSAQESGLGGALRGSPISCQPRRKLTSPPTNEKRGVGKDARGRHFARSSRAGRRQRPTRPTSPPPSARPRLPP